MAKAGDSYIVELRENHLAWGTYRYTDSRPSRSGEAYLPIPAQYAQEFNIYNSNGTHNMDILGKNIFRCITLGVELKGAIEKWIQILIIPILLAVFSQLIQKQESVAVLLSFAVEVLTFVGLMGRSILSINSIIEFFKKEKSSSFVDL